jgi:Zn-dependent protease
LDGSHVLRHFLPESARQLYDRIGIFGLILLFVAGGPVIEAVMRPFLRFFSFIIAKL